MAGREDPKQVEQEVEVPVGTRHEARRPGSAGGGVLRAEEALVQSQWCGPTTSTSDDGKGDDHRPHDEAHHRVLEHRERVERLAAFLDVVL